MLRIDLHQILFLTPPLSGYHHKSLKVLEYTKIHFSQYELKPNQLN
jgi:hypothetical protein